MEGWKESQPSSCCCFKGIFSALLSQFCIHLFYTLYLSSSWRTMGRQLWTILFTSGISDDSTAAVFACIDQWWKKKIHPHHPNWTCSIHPLATYWHGGKVSESLEIYFEICLKCFPLLHSAWNIVSKVKHCCTSEIHLSLFGSIRIEGQKTEIWNRKPWKMMKYSQYHSISINIYHITSTIPLPTQPKASCALIHIQTKWTIALPMEMNKVHCSRA